MVASLLIYSQLKEKNGVKQSINHRFGMFHVMSACFIGENGEMRQCNRVYFLTSFYSMSEKGKLAGE